jgi:hypothetical protein
MAAFANWVSCHRADRQDGGAIESLHTFEDDALADVSMGHDNDVVALHTTIIANSGGANFLLVPGPKGISTSFTKDSPPLPS